MPPEPLVATTPLPNQPPHVPTGTLAALAAFRPAPNDVTGKTRSMIALTLRWIRFWKAELASSADPWASTTVTSQPSFLASAVAPLMKRALLESEALIETIPNKNLPPAGAAGAVVAAVAGALVAPAAGAVVGAAAGAAGAVVAWAAGAAGAVVGAAAGAAGACV